ncbi:MAG: NAD(P)H-binding protein [Rhodoglobus sp.]
MTVFFVTGVTGNLGGAALDGLLDRVPPSDVRVLVRTAAQAPQFEARGLTVRLGDYSDRPSLDAALRGVDRAILVSSPILDPVIRAQQHRSFVAASVHAGVEHIVYTSGMGAAHDPGHSAAENALADSDVGFTILRNALYSDPFVAKAVAEAREGIVRSASEGQAIATAAIADLGEAAAVAVFSPPGRSMWELRGPAWTFDELARRLSLLLGREVTHEEVTDAETGPFAVLFPLIRRGVFAAETGDLTELLGRAPLGITQVAERLLR